MFHPKGLDVDVDEIMLTPDGAVVFVSIQWPDGTTQRGSVAFEQPLASRIACGRVDTGSKLTQEDQSQ